MKNSLRMSVRFTGIIVALIAMFSMTAMAQQGQKGGGRGGATPEERANRQTEMMKDKLSLTAAQEPKVSAINLKYAKKMEDVRAIADTAARRKTALKLNDQKNGELKVVLTADQYKSYLKQVEEMKAHRHEMQR